MVGRPAVGSRRGEDILRQAGQAELDFRGRFRSVTPTSFIRVRPARRGLESAPGLLHSRCCRRQSPAPETDGKESRRSSHAGGPRFVNHERKVSCGYHQRFPRGFFSPRKRNRCNALDDAFRRVPPENRPGPGKITCVRFRSCAKLDIASEQNNHCKRRIESPSGV